MEGERDFNSNVDNLVGTREQHQQPIVLLNQKRNKTPALNSYSVSPQKQGGFLDGQQQTSQFLQPPIVLQSKKNKKHKRMTSAHESNQLRIQEKLRNTQAFGKHYAECTDRRSTILSNNNQKPVVESRSNSVKDNINFWERMSQGVDSNNDIQPRDFNRDQDKNDVSSAKKVDLQELFIRNINKQHDGQRSNSTAMTVKQQFVQPREENSLAKNFLAMVNKEQEETETKDKQIRNSFLQDEIQVILKAQKTNSDVFSQPTGEQNNLHSQKPILQNQNYSNETKQTIIENMRSDDAKPFNITDQPVEQIQHLEFKNREEDPTPSSSQPILLLARNKKKKSPMKNKQPAQHTKQREESEVGGPDILLLQDPKCREQIKNGTYQHLSDRASSELVQLKKKISSQAFVAQNTSSQLLESTQTPVKVEEQSKPVGDDEKHSSDQFKQVQKFEMELTVTESKVRQDEFIIYEQDEIESDRLHDELRLAQPFQLDEPSLNGKDKDEDNTRRKREQISSSGHKQNTLVMKKKKSLLAYQAEEEKRLAEQEFRSSQLQSFNGSPIQLKAKKSKIQSKAKISEGRQSKVNSSALQADIMVLQEVSPDGKTLSSQKIYLQQETNFSQDQQVCQNDLSRSMIQEQTKKQLNCSNLLSSFNNFTNNGKQACLLENQNSMNEKEQNVDKVYQYPDDSDPVYAQQAYNENEIGYGNNLLRNSGEAVHLEKKSLDLDQSIHNSTMFDKSQNNSQFKSANSSNFQDSHQGRQQDDHNSRDLLVMASPANQEEELKRTTSGTNMDMSKTPPGSSPFHEQKGKQDSHEKAEARAQLIKDRLNDILGDSHFDSKAEMGGGDDDDENYDADFRPCLDLEEYLHDEVMPLAKDGLLGIGGKMGYVDENPDHVVIHRPLENSNERILDPELLEPIRFSIDCDAQDLSHMHEEMISKKKKRSESYQSHDQQQDMHNKSEIITNLEEELDSNRQQERSHQKKNTNQLLTKSSEEGNDSIGLDEKEYYGQDLNNKLEVAQIASGLGNIPLSNHISQEDLEELAMLEKGEQLRINQKLEQRNAHRNKSNPLQINKTDSGQSIQLTQSHFISYNNNQRMSEIQNIQRQFGTKDQVSHIDYISKMSSQGERIVGDVICGINYGQVHTGKQSNERSVFAHRPQKDTIKTTCELQRDKQNQSNVSHKLDKSNRTNCDVTYQSEVNLLEKNYVGTDQSRSVISNSYVEDDLLEEKIREQREAELRRLEIELELAQLEAQLNQCQEQEEEESQVREEQTSMVSSQSPFGTKVKLKPPQTVVYVPNEDDDGPSFVLDEIDRELYRHNKYRNTEVNNHYNFRSETYPKEEQQNQNSVSKQMSHSNQAQTLQRNFSAAQFRETQQTSHTVQGVPGFRARQSRNRGDPESENYSLCLPISLEEQEILCSNCYETIPMIMVDQHSVECCLNDEELKHQLNQSLIRNSISQLAPEIRESIVEDKELQLKFLELDQKIFKLINTFQKKLENMKLDEINQEKGTPSKNGGSNSASKRRKRAKNREEEMMIINEILELAMESYELDIEHLAGVCDDLDELEDEYDLNLKLDFNNHLIFNRIMQCVYIKLQVWQDHLYEQDPNAQIPLTSKQMQLRKLSELNENNIQKLTFQAALRPSVFSSNDQYQNDQERHLAEFVARHKAKVFEAKKKRKTVNLFKHKNDKNNQLEHWVVSDLGSDALSVGGDSVSSFNSRGKSFSQAFKSSNALKKKITK